MDSLFGTYELLYPMNWASDARLFRMPGSSLEDEMFVMAAMVTGKGWNSMSIQEVSAEQLAELLHHYHQALGPDSSCENKPDAEAWEHVPQPEKKRLVAASRLALLELTSMAKDVEDSRRYFAKPGQAEWGC